MSAIKLQINNVEFLELLTRVIYLRPRLMLRGLLPEPSTLGDKLKISISVVVSGWLRRFNIWADAQREYGPIGFCLFVKSGRFAIQMKADLNLGKGLAKSNDMGNLR